MTRLQDEWDPVDVHGAEGGPEALLDHRPAAFPVETGAIIMHPLLPAGEIARSVDGDPRAAYWNQVRNGMWIRAALVAMIFSRERNIYDYYLNHNL